MASVDLSKRMNSSHPAMITQSRFRVPESYQYPGDPRTRIQTQWLATAQEPFNPTKNATSTTMNKDFEKYVTVLNSTGDAETVHEHAFTAPSHIDSKHDHGWRRIVRNFSPAWFAATMGTGIVSLLLITIPFQATWLYWLSVAFFALNTVLFTWAFAMSILRYGLYPEIWSAMIRHPVESLFLGTLPMGFATLVQSWCLLCCPYWGHWSVFVAWAGWMVDSVASIGISVGLMFLLISDNDHIQLDRITAPQLLPIVATIVAAGAGTEVAESLMRIGHVNHAVGTLAASYIMWGMATPFAMIVLVIYFQRLALHKLPPREIIVSSFLPLGPLGTGGNTIFYAGKVARELLSHQQVEILREVPGAGDVLYVMGMLMALIMWSFGIVWLILALAAIWSSRPFPFNLGWWAFTFPLGVFAICAINFGVGMPSLFFKVLGTVLGVTVMVLWCVVAAGTAKGVWTGQIFFSPCLKDLPQRKDEPSETYQA